MKKLFFFGSCLVLLAIGGRYGFLHIGNWLTLSEKPQRADVIICLNGNLDRIPKVVELFNLGYADKILVTFPATRKAVIKAGVPDTAVLSLDGGYNSTYDEALQVVRFLEQENLRSALVVSDLYHMYRAKWTYDWLTDSEYIELTYSATEPIVEANEFWWDETRDRRSVLRELPKIVYYWMGHGLFGIRKDPEWIIATEQWYNRMLQRFV